MVGINIEDSLIANGIRTILDKEVFFEKLKLVISKLKEEKVEIFINVRTDTFLLGLENPVQETLQRIKLLEEIGIDGIFVPCITSEKDIKVIVNSTKLPMNVMCMPELSDFKTLKEIGIKRISSGNFLNEYIYKNLEEKGSEIMKKQSFSQFLNNNETYSGKNVSGIVR